MQSQYIPYATVALIATVGLLHFRRNIRRYAPNTLANKFFCAAIAVMSVCSLMEFGFTFHESGIITNPVYCYATEIAYSTASLITAYFWFLSSEIEQESLTVRSKFLRWILCLPIAIMVSLVTTTPIHHMVFYFTEDAHYVRGPLNNVLVYLTVVYIAKSGITALIKSFDKRFYLKRELYRTYFYYMLSILVAQGLQIVLGSALPFRIIGSVFLFYLVQERTMKQNIFTDILSSANNRTAMERYLKGHFDDADEWFAFAMIDLDDFKQINDQYGHLMGDKAIKLFCDVFKASIDENLFFARFGGDEFVLAGKVTSRHQIDDNILRVRRRVADINKKGELPFQMAFSCGVAYKTSDVTTIPELISRADDAMYENKRKYKQQCAGK